MAKVYPFRGLRYALDKVPIDQVATQPYDKISKEMQDRYYALHPHNIARIVLGKSTPEDSDTNNVYTRAAAYLKQWRASGILEQVSTPAFFVYFQRFEGRVRKGFTGIARLEDYKNEVVFPHERTLTGPKKDRLELLRHTKTHFEQIFMLYEDPEQRIDTILDSVASGVPDIDVTDEYGVQHIVWTMTDAATISFIQEQMQDKKLVIADGHHRYETALAYRDEMRTKTGLMDPDAPYERMTMTFFNMHSPGLTILPTHRVLAGLPAFDSRRFFDRAAEFFQLGTPADLTIEVFTDGQTIPLGLRSSLNLGALMPDLSEKQRKLDVVILHRLLLEKCLGITEEAVKKESYITYVRGRDKAIDMVKEGKAQIAFLLNPTRLDQMRDIAYEGNVMPQKSTDFYPKVLSGLVMYSLDE